MAIIPAMKFVSSIVMYGVMGAVLVAGILAATAKGSYWLLIAGFLVYLGMLIKYGCHSH